MQYEKAPRLIRSKGILFFLAGMLLLPLHAYSSVSSCTDGDCIKKAVLAGKSLDSIEKACSSLDGKKSKGFFKADLGHLCRLYVARSKAGTRKTQPCRPFTSRSSDYIFRESSLSIKALAQPVYKKIPAAQRLGDELGKGSSNRTSVSTVTSTIYSSYRMAISLSDKKDGKPSTYRFHIFFCVAGAKGTRGYYQPYFYRYQRYDGYYKKDAKPIFTQQEFIKEAYLTDMKILRQLSGQAMGNVRGIKGHQFVDVNGDGHKDLVFIEYVGSRTYRPGLCLYQPGQEHCKKYTMNKTAKTGIFWVVPEIQLKSKNTLLMILKDKKGKKPAEKHEYKLPKL